MIKIHKFWTTMGITWITLHSAKSSTPGHVSNDSGARIVELYGIFQFCQGWIKIVKSVVFNRRQLTLLLNHDIIPSPLFDFIDRCSIRQMA